MLARRAFATDNEFGDFVQAARRFRDEGRIPHEDLEYFEGQQPQENETGIRADDGTSF
jgi:hypothetical protein